MVFTDFKPLLPNSDYTRHFSSVSYRTLVPKGSIYTTVMPHYHLQNFLSSHLRRVYDTYVFLINAVSIFKISNCKSVPDLEYCLSLFFTHLYPAYSSLWFILDTDEKRSWTTRCAEALRRAFRISVTYNKYDNWVYSFLHVCRCEFLTQNEPHNWILLYSTR